MLTWTTRFIPTTILLTTQDCFLSAPTHIQFSLRYKFSLFCVCLCILYLSWSYCLSHLENVFKWTAEIGRVVMNCVKIMPRLTAPLAVLIHPKRVASELCKHYHFIQWGWYQQRFNQTPLWRVWWLGDHIPSNFILLLLLLLPSVHHNEW